MEQVKQRVGKRLRAGRGAHRIAECHLFEREKQIGARLNAGRERARSRQIAAGEQADECWTSLSASCQRRCAFHL